MHRWPVLALLPLSLIFACNGGGKKGSNNGGNGNNGGDDTGQDEEEYDFEEGCITVDGQGGYAWINDAIVVADPGSTIELCATDAHEEAVVVDKGVHIIGPGIDNFTLAAPTNEPAFEVLADGASITGVNIQSTRSGVLVGETTGVSIDDIQVLEAGNWGISANGATDLAISNVALVGNNYGGIRVDGGSATISDSTLQGNISYGVYATGGADVGLQTSEVSNTEPLDPEAVEDGYGVAADGGSALSLTDNVVSSSAIANVYTDEADASLSGDQLIGGLYGALVSLGAASYQDVTVEDAQYIALYAFTTADPVVVDGATASIAPEDAVDIPYDLFLEEGYGATGAGMVLVSPDVTVSGTSITGYNNAGLYIGSDETGATATISDTTITDVGRFGVINGGMNASFTNTTIDTVKVLDAPEDRIEDSTGNDVLCYYVNFFASVYNVQGTVSWDGGGLSGSAGWGFSNLQGSLSISNATLEDSVCGGIVSLEGALSLDGNTFTNAGDGPHFISSADDAVSVTDNLFTANQWDGEYTATDDYLETYGYRITDTYEDGYAVTIDGQLYQSSNIEIVGNTFEDGDNSLTVAGCTGTIEDNSWTNYRNTALYVVASSASDGSTIPGDITLENATFDGVNGYATYCSGASLEMDEVTIENGAGYEYSYETFYEYDSDGDGEADGSSSWSGSSTSPSIGMYSYGCEVLASDLTIQDSTGNGLEIIGSSSNASTVDIDGLNIARVGSESSYSEAAMRIYSGSGEVSLNMSDVDISDSGELPGVYLYASTSGTIELSADSFSVSDTTGDGIRMAGHGVSADISSLTITDAGDDGIDVEGGDLQVTSGSISNSADAGIRGISDLDGDGYTIADGDCDDDNSSVNPGRSETSGNMLDDDCDGVADDGTDTSDEDGDGYSIADGDCDDRNYYGDDRYPGATEFDNGIDDDCDNVADDALNASVLLDSVTVSGSGESGLDLTDIAASVSDCSITGNSEWGMTCDGSDFATCDGNDLSGNSSGANSGCDVSCGS